jgi:translation elongation factor EF-1beta
MKSGTTTSEILDKINEKLEKLLEQNQHIAEGILAVAGMVKGNEKEEKKPESIEERLKPVNKIMSMPQQFAPQQQSFMQEQNMQMPQQIQPMQNPQQQFGQMPQPQFPKPQMPSMNPMESVEQAPHNEFSDLPPLPPRPPKKGRFSF